MSFWEKHGPPILHNAGGTLLASAITGGALLLVGILKPSLLVQSIPVWVCLLLVLVVCSVCWFMLRKLKQQLQDAKLPTDHAKVEKPMEVATKTEVAATGPAIGGRPTFALRLGEPELDPAQVTILQVLAVRDTRMSSDQISTNVAIQRIKVEYYLTRLEEDQYISVDGLGFYEIEPKGTGYLIERGLL